MSAPLSDQRLEGFTSQLLREELAKAKDGEGSRFRDIDGIVLFVDIVDSTSMTDAIAATGPDGAERLGGILNDYFRHVIDVVSAHGGDVVSIDGDAVIALWRADGSTSAHARSAARAAIALREIDLCWPIQPTAPLRHRLALAAGKFNSVVLSGAGGRCFHVLAGEPLRTIGAILHRGEPGEVIVDSVTAQLLGEAASLEPIQGPVKATHEAARLDFLGDAASEDLVPARAPAPTLWSAPESFLPRVVVVRSQSGLAAWMMEFRVVTLVYVRLGASDVADAAAGARLHGMFEVVTQAAEALDVEIFRVVADEKGVIALIACGLPPFSSESNAAGAVGIAERIREDAARLGVPLSVGVTTGRVFCGLIGNMARREYVLNGPVMNYGARLMQAADDDVLYDAETVRAASGRFTFSAAEEILVKGRGRPLAVHRLSQAFAAPTSLPAGHKALVGRDAEYAELTERLTGGVGGLVVLEGEPGAGKSRLLQALRETAERCGYPAIEAATHVIERATPYYVFRSLLRQLLRERGDGESASLPVLRTRLHEALAGTDLGEKAALIEDVMPLGLPSTDLAAQIKGAARQAGIEDIVVALAARKTADRTPLILLDDLHWIDALSADLLLAIARRLPQLLIVATSRPLDVTEAPHGGRVLQRASRRIPVARIDSKGTAQIISDMLKAESVPRRLVEFVYGQSEGLPIHIEQLVLSLQEHGLIEARDGKCLVHASDLTTAAVPHKLRDLVVGRIDALGQVDQLVAKVASVIGRVFEMEALRAIYPIATETFSLEASVRSLARAGILEPASGGDSAAHAFRHVIIQEATYDLLAYAQRRSLHLRLVEQIERRHAEALEPHYSELAHHCEHAGETPRAVEFRLSAASLAVLRSANDDALMHVERADRLAKRERLALSDAQRSQFAFLRGEALHALARFSEAESHFKECMRLNGIERPQTPLRMRVSTLGQVGRQAAHRFGLMRAPHDEAMRQRERLSALVHTRLAEHAYFMCRSAELEHDTLAALNQAEKSRRGVRNDRRLRGIGDRTWNDPPLRARPLLPSARHRRIETGRRVAGPGLRPTLRRGLLRAHLRLGRRPHPSAGGCQGLRASRRPVPQTVLQVAAVKYRDCDRGISRLAGDPERVRAGRGSGLDRLGASLAARGHDHTRHVRGPSSRRRGAAHGVRPRVGLAPGRRLPLRRHDRRRASQVRRRRGCAAHRRQGIAEHARRLLHDGFGVEQRERGGGGLSSNFSNEAKDTADATRRCTPAPPRPAAPSARTPLAPGYAVRARWCSKGVLRSPSSGRAGRSRSSSARWVGRGVCGCRSRRR